MFGEAVSGNVWSPRVQEIVEFTSTWSMQWSSTFAEQGEHTHVAYRSGAKSVIDYVCFANTAGSKAIFDVRISHTAGISSDHSALLAQLCVAERPNARSSVKHVPVLRSFESKNQFAVLMDGEIQECSSIEAFTQSLVSSFDKAAKIDRVNKVKEPSFKEVLAQDFARVHAAASGEERRLAVKELNLKKKGLSKSRAVDRFVQQGLKQPRSSKQKQKGYHALKCQGVLTWDVQL
jgi:hypothetical protein